MKVEALFPLIGINNRLGANQPDYQLNGISALVVGELPPPYMRIIGSGHTQLVSTAQSAPCPSPSAAKGGKSCPILMKEPALIYLKM